MRLDTKRGNLLNSKPAVKHARLDSHTFKLRADAIKADLRAGGAVKYNFWLPETHYLPYIIHPEERIKGSVYGRYKDRNGTVGRGALIATDQRVIFLDKKPLYVHYDELTFNIVGWVTYTRVSLMGYVTLHTRLGDFKLRTFNHKNAANFVNYIEEKCLQNAETFEEKFEHVT
jgi:hypothetical protein